MNVNALKFSFGRPDPVHKKMLWLLYDAPLYRKMVSPFLGLAVRSNVRLPRFLHAFLVPGVPTQDDAKVLAMRRKRLDLPGGSPVVRELRDKGYADVTKIVNLTPAEIEEARNHFLTANGYDSQVPIQSSLQPRLVSELKNKPEVNYMVPRRL